MEITIALLETAMKESGGRRFLIDGFPRAMDQALKFEETVVKSKMVLYFECPEEEMMKRLLKRGETSGRVDDNEDSIKKRFKTFRETSYPVIEHYAKHGKVAAISCLNSKENVYRDVRRVFENLLARANIAELPSDDPNGYVAIEEQIPISGNHNHQT
jgi:UMP-CMP kinase